MRKGNPKDEPRRQILRALITENGEHAEFVKRFNLKPSQASHISQIVNGYSFGERAAENMRVLLNLPAGFFNVEDKETSGNITSTLSGIQRRALKLLEEMDSKARTAWFAVGASLAKPDKSVVNDALTKPQSDHGVIGQGKTIEFERPEVTPRKRRIRARGPINSGSISTPARKPKLKRNKDAG